MLATFHELWYHNYLSSLSEQCRDFNEVKFHSKISVDDVVIVKSPPKSRLFCILGSALE